MATAKVNSMSYQDIVNDIARITAQITEKQIPSPREDLFALGIDSMVMLDLLAALEEHFGITLNESITREFRTIERIARIIRDTASA